MKSKRNILIVGPGRHGKDTAAEILSEILSIKFVSSSEFANRAAGIFLTLRDKYGYKTEEECFIDRANHRKEWYDLICAYNKDDPSRLARELLEDCNIYVGMRDKLEFDSARELFHVVLWIDADDRVREIDPTIKIEKKDADVIIQNNGTREDFARKVARFASLFA